MASPKIHVNNKGIPLLFTSSTTTGETYVVIKIDFRDVVGGDSRLLPYWRAVKLYREGKTGGLPPEYYWLYIESNPHKIGGKVIASSLMASLPSHVLCKMQQNFIGSRTISELTGEIIE